jgi:hypothetical protein
MAAQGGVSSKTEFGEKFSPCRVMDTGRPGSIEGDSGSTEASTGAALMTCNWTVRETPRLGDGFSTDTSNEPPDSSELAGIKAVNDVGLLN